MKTSYAVRRPVSNDWLERRRDRRRWHDLWLTLSLVLPLLAGLLGYVWIRLDVIAIGAKIDRVEHRLIERRNDERRLQLMSARLESPSLIEERAHEELGLVPLPIDQMVFVAEGP